MAYLEITGLPIKGGQSDFGPTVNLTLEKGRGLSILAVDGDLPRLVKDAITGVGQFSGEIFLNELRIDSIPSRNRSVEVLGDIPGIIPRMTVRENLEQAIGERALTDMERTFMVERELSESMLMGFDKVKVESLDAVHRTSLAAARAVLRSKDLVLVVELPSPGLKNRAVSKWMPGLYIDSLLDIKNLFRRHKVTWINFIPDPVVVNILSDRLAIFSADQMVQEGSLRECINAPKTRMVADFLAFPGINYKKTKIERDGPFLMLRAGRYGFRLSEYAKRHLEAKEGDEIILGIRAEHIGLRAFETGDPTIMNLAKVVQVDSFPGAQIVRLDLEGEVWTALVESGRAVFTGQLVELRPDPDRINLFHPLSGFSLLD